MCNRSDRTCQSDVLILLAIAWKIVYSLLRNKSYLIVKKHRVVISKYLRSVDLRFFQIFYSGRPISLI